MPDYEVHLDNTELVVRRALRTYGELNKIKVHPDDLKLREEILGDIHVLCQKVITQAWNIWPEYSYSEEEQLRRARFFQNKKMLWIANK
jgi:hypothetical protein